MGERESGSRRCGPAALTSAVLGVDPCCSSLRATAAVFLLAALSACIVGAWCGGSVITTRACLDTLRAAAVWRADGR
jgi:hypothetical protein